MLQTKLPESSSHQQTIKIRGENLRSGSGAEKTGAGSSNIANIQTKYGGFSDENFYVDAILPSAADGNRHI